MAEKDLFYVIVEERAQIIFAIEAENAEDAERIGYNYVGNHIHPVELNFVDRTAVAYRAEVHKRMSESVRPMNKGVDPIADAAAHLRQSLKDVINPVHSHKKQEFLDLAKTVLEEFEAEIAIQLAPKKKGMGM